MVRPELSKRNSKVLMKVTAALSPVYQFTVQQVANIMLSILIDNVDIDILTNAVKNQALKAIKETENFIKQ